MDDILKQSLLYDFYGELLTEHQKEIYEDFVLNDLSLGEIAQERGISRQGVHDLVKRCNKILNGYEEKLHLIERFTDTKQKVSKICELVDISEKNSDGNKADNSKDINREIIKKIKIIANEILDNY